MSNYNSDELIHIKDGDVEYIKFKILEKYSDKLLHLITLRHGGVSRDVYKSLNFRSAGNDAVNNVLTNLEIVSKKIGINSNDETFSKVLEFVKKTVRKTKLIPVQFQNISCFLPQTLLTVCGQVFK